MPENTYPSGRRTSPLALALLGRRVRFGDVQWSPDGQRLIWLESRPGPQSAPGFPSGQGVLVQSSGGETPQDLTSPAHSVRGHWGYGGGEFCAGQHFALYTEKDGRLYRQNYTGGQPLALTPTGIKISAPQISPDGRTAACIAMQGQAEWLALASTEGLTPLVTLDRGADFYMQPAWSPDGRHLAWIEWDHPGLPWEGCRLMLAEFNPENLAMGDRRLIAGGETAPVFQPAFSPDGRWLAWISETGEWESLNLLDLLSGEEHTLVNNRVLSQPAWEQGLRMFAWEADSRSVIFLSIENAHAGLNRASLDGSQPERLSLGEFTWLDHSIPGPGWENRRDCVSSAPPAGSGVRPAWQSKNPAQRSARPAPGGAIPGGTGQLAGAGRHAHPCIIQPPAAYGRQRPAPGGGVHSRRSDHPALCPL